MRRWLPTKGDLRSGKLFGIAKLAFVAVATLLALLLTGFVFNFPLILLGYGVVQGLLSTNARRGSRRHGVALSQIAPWPLPSDTFPARLVYTRGIDAFGVDEALVSFGDGWMTVEGVCTSFSLRKDDTYVLHREGGGCDLLLGDEEQIRVEPYDALEIGGESVRSLRNRFEIGLERWLGDRTPDGAPVFPSVPGRSVPAMPVTGSMAYGGGLLALVSVMLFETVVQHKLHPVYAISFGIGMAFLAKSGARFRKECARRRALPPSLRPQCSWRGES